MTHSPRPSDEVVHTPYVPETTPSEGRSPLVAVGVYLPMTTSATMLAGGVVGIDFSIGSGNTLVSVIAST